MSSLSPARSAAFELLLQLRRDPGLHSDTLLHAKRVDGLSSRDKNLTTTLVMGVLRWQLVLQQRIREALTQGKRHLGDPVQIALELGALQLLLLDRIPAHAAIFESVELVRHTGNTYAVGLVNAVLRKLQHAPRLTESVAAHPRWLFDRWASAYGEPSATVLCNYDQLPPPTTIRLLSPQAEAALQQLGIELEAATFVTQARRVVAGDVSEAAQLFRIQDEGSQLIAEVAGRGTEILDCCAAPGGKTAILAEHNPQASILASDISPRRLEAMEKSLGAQHISYRVLDAMQLPFEQRFDLVLCDAPCSGTGTIGRHPEIRHRVTVDDFARHHDRQVRLLCSAMRALCPGGRLVYSTCSLEPEENETVIAEALEQQKGFKLTPWRDQIKAREAEGVLHPGTAERLLPTGAPDIFLHTLPGSYPGDGFFAACLALS